MLTKEKKLRRKKLLKAKEIEGNQWKTINILR